MMTNFYKIVSVQFVQPKIEEMEKLGVKRNDGRGVKKCILKVKI